MTDWKRKAFELYRLLDDIDTADDIAKDNENMYRNLVRGYHNKRFHVVADQESAELYEEYYPKDTGVMERNGRPNPMTKPTVEEMKAENEELRRKLDDAMGALKTL